MAVQYQYQKLGKVFGPVSFRDLVALVRDAQLSTDDLVQADWEKRWIPAATVVGLFHMAGRDDVLKQWEMERQAGQEAKACTTEVLEAAPDAYNNGLSSMVEGDGNAVDFPILHQHLRDNAFDDIRQVESDLQQKIRYTLQEAMVQQELGSRRGIVTLLCQKLTKLSEVALPHALRWGGALLTANLLGWRIVEWSLLEMRTFPIAGESLTFPSHFPLWGECAQSLYLLLLLDSMLLAGVLGYWGIRLLESLVDS